MDAGTAVADAGTARFFSVPPERAAEGVPIADLLKAIHPDDRAEVKQRVTEAVESTSCGAARFRVRQSDGTWSNCLAHGHCHDLDGKLSVSGVVYALPEFEYGKRQRKTVPPRELQCLDWCSRGKTNWEIGQILGISARTVEHHIASAIRRFGCATRVEAVAQALRLGLIA